MLWKISHNIKQLSVCSKGKSYKHTRNHAEKIKKKENTR